MHRNTYNDSYSYSSKDKAEKLDLLDLDNEILALYIVYLVISRLLK